MTRFARPADEAGDIDPRSSDDGAAERPSGSRFARILGAVGLLALTVLLFFLLTDDGFRVTATDVDVIGVRLADPAAVREHIGDIERGPNVFRLRAESMVEGLGALPEVAFARTFVALPDSITVEIIERLPIFIWSNGGEVWFVDESGVLFSPRDDSLVAAAIEAVGAGSVAAASPLAGADVDGGADDVILDDAAAVGAEVALATLPLLEDARLVETFMPGDRLPALDFAVMRQLLGITPEFIGSESAAISLRIDEHDGYVLTSEDFDWKAVFGHYRPTVQPPTVIPLQAQCLASLLATKPERRLDRIVLVPSEERCGTFRTVGSRGDS